MRNAPDRERLAVAASPPPSPWHCQLPAAWAGNSRTRRSRKSWSRPSAAVENIQDVPVSVSTLAGEGLDVARSGGDDIRFLSARVPSLNIESSFGRAFPRFYIRGLGNTDFDLNASQPVSLVYDDVVQENPILKGFPVFDLEQVEVLRGPQGTLFGRNTPAGVVKFDSVRPSQDQRRLRPGELRLRQQLDQRRGRRRRRALATPGPRASRASTSTATTGSTTLFTGEGDAARGLRRHRRARCSSCTSPSHASARCSTCTRATSTARRACSAPTSSSRARNDLVRGFDEHKVSLDGANDPELDSIGGSLRLALGFRPRDAALDHRLRDGRRATAAATSTAASAPFFGAADSGPGFIPFPSETADGMPNHEQITQEFRLESREWGAVRLAGRRLLLRREPRHRQLQLRHARRWRAGRLRRSSSRTTPPTPCSASGDYDVNDAFTLRGGLRYTNDEKDFTAERFTSPFGAGPDRPDAACIRRQTTSAGTSAAPGRSATTPTSTRASPTASARRAIQGRHPVRRHGLGGGGRDHHLVRGRHQDRACSTTAAGSTSPSTSTRWTTSSSRRSAAAANFNTLINADKTDGQGFELDFAGLPHRQPAGHARRSATTTPRSRTRTSRCQPCGGGCTVTDPGRRSVGRPRSASTATRCRRRPKWIANLTARYGMPVGDAASSSSTPTGPTAARSTSSCTSRRSSPATALLEGGLRLGYAGTTASTKLAALRAQHHRRGSSVVGGIDFNNLTGFDQRAAHRYGMSSSSRSSESGPARMPELPEVETTRRGIEPWLVGHRIEEVLVRERRLRWPVSRGLPAKLARPRVRSVGRRAKYLLIATDAGTAHPAPRHVRQPARHGRRRAAARARSRRHRAGLRALPAVQRSAPFRLPAVHDGRPAAPPAARGPRRGAAVRTNSTATRSGAARAAGGVSIKAFIMDSRSVVGVGNIYASEALFRAGIRPGLAAGKVSRERMAALVTSDPRGADRGDRRRRHDAQGLRGSLRNARLFPPETVRLREGRQALPEMPDADPPVRAGTAQHLLVPALPALARSARGAPLARASATAGCTKCETSPPSIAISRTSVDEMKVNCSCGVRKT